MIKTQQPEQYSKRILLVVIGMTPQIVTEALYKLAVDSDPVYVPTEVHIVTTTEGAKSAEVALLGVPGSKGWFHQFCEDFGLNDILFTDKQIHIIEDTEGQFINDAESSQHNQVAADFITKLVQGFAEDKSSAIHVSLAGGRKTMSFYAGYALSLYGRMQDKLSHILVNTPFMNHKEFFYPRPAAERLEINNRYYSTSDAQIILANIPYVRMRYHVPRQLLNGKAGFQETVDKIQKFGSAESIEINSENQTLKLNGVEVQLGPSDFAFYLWMSERKANNQSPLVLDADEFLSDYLEVYARFINRNGGMFARAEYVAKNKTFLDQKQYFQTKCSTIRNKIEGVLGKRLAKPFLIQLADFEEGSGYEISLASKNIRIL